MQPHCPHGVRSRAECDFGASSVPPSLQAPLPPGPVNEKAADLAWCAVQCQAQGHCCNDPSRGSNQMISCAQACMMRASCQSTEAMLSANGGMCNHRGNSGRSLIVMGQGYSLCQRCDDLQPHCPHGVQSRAECQWRDLQPQKEFWLLAHCDGARFSLCQRCDDLQPYGIS